MSSDSELVSGKRKQPKASVLTEDEKKVSCLFNRIKSRTH